MKYVNNDDCYSSIAVRQVLGCLVLNPVLLADKKINKFDFVDTFHQVVFYAINSNYQMGITKLDGASINFYLKNNYPHFYRIFNAVNGVKFIHDITDPKFLKPENFESYY